MPANRHTIAEIGSVEVPVTCLRAILRAKNLRPVLPYSFRSTTQEANYVHSLTPPGGGLQSVVQRCVSGFYLTRLLTRQAMV